MIATRDLTPPPVCVAPFGNRSAFALAALVLALAVTLGGPPEARAVTINVNTTAQFASPSDCTLGDAIKAANTDTAVNGCVAGLGADTIVLPAGTYLLTQDNNPSRAAATPDMTTTLTVQGAGAGATILQRDAGAPDMAILYQYGGTLTLNDLTLKGGKPALGVAYGTALTINRCTFDSNPVRAIEYYSLSNLTIDDSTFTNNSYPGSSGGRFTGAMPTF